MPKDIREISPCGDCIRQHHPVEFSDANAPGATAYLLSDAIEVTLDPVSLDNDVEQAAVNFIHNYHEGVPSAAKGAIGYCARQIGRGTCSLWELDYKAGQVVIRK